MNRLVAVVLSLLCSSAVLMSSVSAAEQPGDSTHSWLNGRWTGPAPGGGSLEMDIRVVNQNQIKGTARIAGGRRGYNPSVSGTVNGDRIQLELYNPGSGNNVKFDLTRVNGELKGARKGEEVTFTKQ